MDRLRVIAATAIIVYHAWLFSGQPALDHGLLRALVAAGWAGVDVFCVLSGFSMFLASGHEEESFAAYAKRRFLRVAPPYYVSLLLIITAYPWITLHHSPMPSEQASGVWVFVAHAVFLQAPLFGLSDRAGFGINQALWFVSVLAAFYVIFPLVVRAFARRPLQWVLGTLAFSTLWKGGVALVAQHDDMSGIHLGLQFPSYAGHFALGMAAAAMVTHTSVAERRAWKRRATAGRVVAVVALLGFVAYLGAHDLGPEHTLRFVADIPIAVLAAVIVLATVMSGRGRAPRLGQAVSGATYGMYLFHMPILGFALGHGIQPNGTLRSFALLAAATWIGALAAGALSLQLIERPLRRMATRPRRVAVRRPPPRRTAPRTEVVAH